MTRIWWILTWALKSLKNLHFHCGSYCAKYLKFDLKRYRGVIFHDTEDDAIFEEKLTRGLEKEMRNMANFHQSTWKSHNWDVDGVL